MLRNRLTYKSIIQEEVRKQGLAAKTNRGLKSYLKRVSAQRWVRPWIDYDMAKALKHMISTYATDQDMAQKVTNMIDELVENRDGKYDLYTKMMYDRDKIYSNIENFFTPEKPDFSYNEHYKFALGVVKNILDSAFTGYLAPKDIKRGMDLKDVLSTDDTAMGYLCLDSKKKDEKELLIDVALRLKEALPNDPIVIAVYNRVQIGGGVNPESGELLPDTLKNKLRAVCGVDGATSLLEACYAKPFLTKVMSKLKQYAGAKDPDTINELLQQWFRQDKNWTSGDFSTFDQTAPSWVIRDAFGLVKNYYKSTKDKQVMDWCCDQFINATFLYHDGSERRKKKGILSGSQWTQIIGSLVNMIVILTSLAAMIHEEVAPGKRWNDSCERRFFYELTGRPITASKLRRAEWSRIRMMVMGDDNIFFTKNPINLHFISKYIQHNFGMALHEDKTSRFGKDDAYHPEFLKRVWKPAGAYRNIFELIINILTPERERSYDGYTPFEIIYGYYITYPLAFSGLFTGVDLLDEMGGSSKILKLGQVSPSDLPGSLRVLVMNDPRFFDKLARIARRVLRDRAAKQVKINQPKRKLVVA